LKQALGNFGYSTVFWTSNITSFPNKAPDEIAERMADRVGSGGIILLHNGQDQTVFVLPKLIDILKRRGFRLVTVSQLLERS
jgi:peptidoglycan/xylan/chitin deacetylase (PgdA/CDA1 family)